jgi:hypothetical protein
MKIREILASELTNFLTETKKADEYLKEHKAEVITAIGAVAGILLVKKLFLSNNDKTNETKTQEAKQ